MPVKLQYFTAVSEGKFVRLDWTTSSEENNDRFEVQRSPNGNSWETIASVKGKGNSSASTRYTSYDNKPLLGENFYRLKQVDVNGRYATSSVKLVNMMGSGNAEIIISPNPSRSTISFTFQNKQAAEVLAVLTDANGRILHQQKFTNVSSGSINQLSLKQKPPARVAFTASGAASTGARCCRSGGPNSPVPGCRESIPAQPCRSKCAQSGCPVMRACGDCCRRA